MKFSREIIINVQSFKNWVDLFKIDKETYFTKMRYKKMYQVKLIHFLFSTNSNDLNELKSDFLYYPSINTDFLFYIKIYAKIKFTCLF